MKRLTCLLLCLIFCFSLVGCAPGGYLNSTEGDITVSLPERTDPRLPEFTEEQKLILGRWTLTSLTIDGTEQVFENSHYTFSETGRLTAVISGRKDDGSFYFKDDVLYLWNKPVEYKIEGSTLTITDRSNKIHLLTKQEEPQE